MLTQAQAAGLGWPAAPGLRPGRRRRAAPAAVAGAGRGGRRLPQKRGREREKERGRERSEREKGEGGLSAPLWLVATSVANREREKDREKMREGAGCRPLHARAQGARRPPGRAQAAGVAPAAVSPRRGCWRREERLGGGGGRGRILGEEEKKEEKEKEKKRKRKERKRKREGRRRWPDWGLLAGVVVARGAGGGGRWWLGWGVGLVAGQKREGKKKKRNEKKRKEKEKKRKGLVEMGWMGEGINEGGEVVSPTWRGVG